MVDRTLRRILILAGIALILWVLYLLKPVVVPFVAAFLIAYLFSPLVNVCTALGWLDGSRSVSYLSGLGSWLHW